MIDHVISTPELEPVHGVKVGLSPPKTNIQDSEHDFRQSLLKWFRRFIPTTKEVKLYIGIILCGLSIWASAYCVFKEAVGLDSPLVHMSALVVGGYLLGNMLERCFTLHPVVGMTLAGVLARVLTSTNYLEDPMINIIDYHLRRVYPVIILTRGPLGWDWAYIRGDARRVCCLATLPWLAECCAYVGLALWLLDFPWYWGLHLGSILSSVSPALVAPAAAALAARGLGRRRLALLVANAGGLDTALTEGVCGVISSSIFYPAPPWYRIVKALLAIFAGIALGVAWGCVAAAVPAPGDALAAPVRSVLVLGGGLALSYAAAALGWGGASGVAVMVCAATAATRWARAGWPLADNPVAAVFAALWRLAEPMLFTLSGYHFEPSSLTWPVSARIVSCILLALALRLLAAGLVCRAGRLSRRESLFVAVTWIPKAIVEAVLVRAATDSLGSAPAAPEDRAAAALHANIIVIAILITSTVGPLLTNTLGPVLLRENTRVVPAEIYRSHTLPPSSIIHQ